MYGLWRACRARCGQHATEQFQRSSSSSSSLSSSEAVSVLTTMMSMVLDFHRHRRCHAVDGTETVYDTVIIGLGNRAAGAARLYARNKRRRQVYCSV